MVYIGTVLVGVIIMDKVFFKLLITRQYIQVQHTDIVYINTQNFKVDSLIY